MELNHFFLISARWTKSCSSNISNPLFYVIAYKNSTWFWHLAKFDKLFDEYISGWLWALPGFKKKIVFSAGVRAVSNTSKSTSSPTIIVVFVQLYPNIFPIMSKKYFYLHYSYREYIRDVLMHIMAHRYISETVPFRKKILICFL